MNCPSCGAPMHLDPGQDSMTCTYCHNVYFPEKDAQGVRVFPEASEDECPVCRVPLQHAALAKVRILYCTHCRGMLIAMPVFVELIDELRAGHSGNVIPPPPDPKELQRKLTCPQCHKPMGTHYYSGGGNVILESCDACELDWLDHGKLMRIVHAPDHTYENSDDML